MGDYQVQKKRDGQSWENWGTIFASSFDEAKKEFASNMMKGNWEKSNDTLWLDSEDGVEEGWYIEGELLVSKADIEAGFDFWTEDVWSYRVLNIDEEV